MRSIVGESVALLVLSASWIDYKARVSFLLLLSLIFQLSLLLVIQENLVYVEVVIVVYVPNIRRLHNGNRLLAFLLRQNGRSIVSLDGLVLLKAKVFAYKHILADGIILNRIYRSLHWLERSNWLGCLMLLIAFLILHVDIHCLALTVSTLLTFLISNISFRSLLSSCVLSGILLLSSSPVYLVLRNSWRRLRYCLLLSVYVLSHLDWGEWTCCSSHFELSVLGNASSIQITYIAIA